MRRRHLPRQAAALAGVFAVVVASDQAAKYVAWRRNAALINEGGFIALRRDMRAWFAAPTAGAVADVVGALLVALGVAVVLHRRRRPSVLLGSGLLAAGWTSNLLDRFGLHDWTAPGSVRGVVDFIPSGGGSRSNLADVWIVTGLVVLTVAALRHRPARRGEPPAAVRPDPGTRFAPLGGA